MKPHGQSPWRAPLRLWGGIPSEPTAEGRGASRGIESRAKALLAARAALEKQAEEVVVLDVHAVSTVTDFFVICTAGSSPQIAAIQERIEAVLAQQGGNVWHTEGGSKGPAGALPDEPQWVLMDCGDIVVHLLDQRARAFYRLEELWADAPRIPVHSSHLHAT